MQVKLEVNQALERVDDLGRALLKALTARWSDSDESRYAQGFVDAYLGQSYADGLLPKHGLTVFVPTGDPYRDGWLAGMTARELSRN